MSGRPDDKAKEEIAAKIAHREAELARLREENPKPDFMEKNSILRGLAPDAMCVLATWTATAPKHVDRTEHSARAR